MKDLLSDVWGVPAPIWDRLEWGTGPALPTRPAFPADLHVFLQEETRPPEEGELWRSTTEVRSSFGHWCAVRGLAVPDLREFSTWLSQAGISRDWKSKRHRDQAGSVMAWELFVAKGCPTPAYSLGSRAVEDFLLSSGILPSRRLSGAVAGSDTEACVVACHLGLPVPEEARLRTARRLGELAWGGDMWAVSALIAVGAGETPPRRTDPKPWAPVTRGLRHGGGGPGGATVEPTGAGDDD